MKKSILLAAILMLAFGIAGAQGRRVVFIGDSITDGNWGSPYSVKPTSAERSHTDMNHIYGHSYVMLIASDWQSRHPKSGYSFYNRGFSGHKLPDLAARWQEDVLDLHPDVLSVLVGVNDMGNAFSKGEAESFDFDGWKEICCSVLGSRIPLSSWFSAHLSSPGRGVPVIFPTMRPVKRWSGILPKSSGNFPGNAGPSASRSTHCSRNW